MSRSRVVAFLLAFAAFGAAAQRSELRVVNGDGRGVIVDAATGREGLSGVAWIEWTMHRADGKGGEKRVVQTISTVGMTSSPAFYVSPSRVPNVAGWQVDASVTPTLRVFAAGYKPSARMRWDEKGVAISVEKLPETREALLADLRAQRRDIDRELAAGDRAEALELQAALLNQFDWRCRALTPDLQAGLCYDANSDVGRKVYALRHASERVEYGEGGVRIVTRTEAPRAQASAVAPSGPAPVRPVSGFSIEPAK